MNNEVKRTNGWPLAGRVIGVILLATLVGCPALPETAEEDEAVEVIPPPPLSLLLVDTPGIAPLIERQWSARRDGQLNSTEITFEDLQANDFREVKENDVVIYPVELIGELVSRKLLLEVPKITWNSDELNKKELLRKSRTRFVQYGGDAWGTPLGSPQLVMMYREDVLKQLGEEPPKTWEQFFSLVNKLKVSELKDSEGNSLPVAVDIPLADRWASVSFLAMCAADIRYRGKLSTVFENSDMQPLINQKPFVAKLSALKKAADESDLRWSPADAYRRMLEGDCAIAIGWPSMGLLEKAPPANEHVRVARLPGSADWFDFDEQVFVRRDKDDPIHVDLLGFDGRMASVAENSGNTLTAFEFISWLSSKQISLLYLPQSASGAAFRASHLGNMARWTGEGLAPDAIDQYSEILKDADLSNTSFVFPRIPGVRDYRSGLDAAIQDCLSGGTDPQSALDNVVQQWKGVTNNQGLENQKSWLRKSVGF